MRLCSGLHSAVQPVACAHIGAAGPVGVQGMDGQYIQSILQQILPNAFIHDIGHRVTPLTILASRHWAGEWSKGGSIVSTFARAISTPLR